MPQTKKRTTSAGRSTPSRARSRKVTTKKERGKKVSRGPRARTGKRTKVKTKPKPVRRRVKPKSEITTPSDLKWVEEDPKDHLLSRFIYDSKNKVVGESIGVEGKRLIMKSGKYFYSIPLKNIKEKETTLALVGRINKKQAQKLGEAWRKRALDPLYQKKK